MRLAMHPFFFLLMVKVHDPNGYFYIACYALQGGGRKRVRL